MKYFAIEYPNHTTLLVKDEHKLERVLIELLNASGLRWHGTIYNPQSFLSLREVDSPDDRQKLIAKELTKVLIG
jgi:hypothetical protein